MFDAVDKALVWLIDGADGLPQYQALQDAEVSFRMPLKDPQPGTTDLVLDLYMYEAHENRELRDPVPIVSQAGGTYTRKRPPLRVDCRYIATAWSRLGGDAQIELEHRLLGQALRWLSRFPTIPDDAFAGDVLADPPFPHPTLVAQLGDAKGMGEFWSAMGAPPRPSFNVIVTMAIDLELASEPIPRVLAKGLRDGIRTPGADALKAGTDSFQFRQVSGIVFDVLETIPLAGIDVTLLERGLVQRTDAFGRYTFRVKRDGHYTVQTAEMESPTTGKTYMQNEIDVEVPLPPGNPLTKYDVPLTPA